MKIVTIIILAYFTLIYPFEKLKILRRYKRKIKSSTRSSYDEIIFERLLFDRTVFKVSKTFPIKKKKKPKLQHVRQLLSLRAYNLFIFL